MVPGMLPKVFWWATSFTVRAVAPIAEGVPQVSPSSE